MAKQNNLNQMKKDFALLNDDAIVAKDVVNNDFDKSILTDDNGYMDNSEKLLDALLGIIK